MKKRTAGILLGLAFSALLLTGCKENKATEAVNESEKTEKEGTGVDEETEALQEEEKAEEADAGEEAELYQKIGVLFPGEAVEKRWITDSMEITKSLQEGGYGADIYYAEGDAELQISQLKELLEGETLALVIDPVDEYAMAEYLEEAKEKSIPVFSYDDLIRDTDAVKYYVTFDARKTGQDIGNSIVEKLGLEKARENKESRTIEFLMGSPDDNAALFMYNGMMEILGEYLEDGTLVSQSQKTSFDDTAVMRWSRYGARNRMEEILEEFYGDGEYPDIVCTAYDGLAFGAMEALEDAQLLPGGEQWPFITGVGCEEEGVIAVAEGKMAFSVFLDNRTLAQECAKMVTTYLDGDKPEVLDYEQYDNGKKIIGTYTCKGEVIDQDNYRLVIDNGYYTEAEILPRIQPSSTPVPTVTPEAEKTPTPTPESEEDEEAPTPVPESEEAEETPTPTPPPAPEEKGVETPTPAPEGNAV